MPACGGRADHVLRKIIILLFFGNRGLLRATRLEQRDVRVVTNVEAGCDGRDGCARRAQAARTAKSCGPGLSMLRSSPWSLLDGTRGRWGQESRSPGRARRTPLTPSRGEGRVCPAVPVVPAACILLSRRATGLSRGPAFLAPSRCSEGHDECITRVSPAARRRDRVSLANGANPILMASSRTSAHRVRRSGTENSREACEARWSTDPVRPHPPVAMGPCARPGRHRKVRRATRAKEAHLD